MIRAFGYLRVSGKDQIEGDGFPRQRAAIRAYAQVNGMRIVEWFEEKAQPGSTEWSVRPAWLEMISRMNGTKTILIEKLDRLARDLMIQEHIILDLRRRKVDLISVADAEAQLCIDDPGRKLLRQIMGAISEYDRAMITAKLAAARKRKKDETGRCEGQKPYGAKPGEESGLLLMQRLRESCKSYQAIAVDMDQSQHKTRNGKPWRATSICRILARDHAK